ncbi:MAG: hypothetical protein EU549_01865 [Promethearchaeota archaeon]|nr:MAG: hypothetical protein EU549_01865 [Candidatus Lokiarchaeota archaeon]
MNHLWDTRADEVLPGDKRRRVVPLKQFIDKDGYTTYLFTSYIFNNPEYVIPPRGEDYELFKKFLDGGSRQYPSDGVIPVDIVANETSKILNRIKEIAYDSSHAFHKIANDLLSISSSGNAGALYKLVRGTLYLYLGNFTTRDWRRKRATDDIDFWIENPLLFDYVMKHIKEGWKYNKNSREWEKNVHWKDLWTSEDRRGLLIASNDINLKMDFGSGSIVQGTGLRNITKKKILRGHDVDLSDIINCAIINNIRVNNQKGAWASIVECANTRNSRTTSNIISLCRLSCGVAKYIRRVGLAIKKYKDEFKDKDKFSNKDVVKICKVSSHWLSDQTYIPVKTRNRIYKNLLKQEKRKIQYANNLIFFSDQVLSVLNSKYKYLKIRFEVIK